VFSRKTHLHLVPRLSVSARSPGYDDGQLLAAVRTGDPRAAEALHDRARPLVDRTVGRLLGAADSDQEDLAQMAMIELCRTIDRYRGECSLDAWACTIAARVVYKHIRRRQLERRLFVADSAAAAEVPGASQPARNVMLNRLARRVGSHLEAMDPGRACAVTLHDVFGYDLKEIALIMNVSAAAAQSRLSRGRRELHERIAADPELSDALEPWEGGTAA
jgi:RNA polymerase sigma-70 factor (ECF subfamily)